MKILITGVAGFIGSNLAEQLLKENHEIIGIDNFDPFYDRKIKENNILPLNRFSNFKMYEEDILNKKRLDFIFNYEKPFIVIHLGGKAGVRQSIKNPISCVEVNVNGTLNILEAMKKVNISKLIFASSSSVYGNNKTIPFSESNIVDSPISPYAFSKKSAELLCHTYHHLYNFDIFCLRFFTVYGSKQRPDLAINKFTKALLFGEQIIFFGDGSTSRDYTHVSDIINGIKSSILNLKGFEIINLGSSQPISLKELIEYLEIYTGKKAKLKITSSQAGDVFLTYANIEKASRILNYKPLVNIEDGLRDYVKLYEQNI